MAKKMKPKMMMKGKMGKKPMVAKNDAMPEKGAKKGMMKRLEGREL